MGIIANRQKQTCYLLIFSVSPRYTNLLRPVSLHSVLTLSTAGDNRWIGCIISQCWRKRGKRFGKSWRAFACKRFFSKAGNAYPLRRWQINKLCKTSGSFYIWTARIIRYFISPRTEKTVQGCRYFVFHFVILGKIELIRV